MHSDLLIHLQCLQQNYLFVIKKLSDDVMGLQWNIDLTKCQETGQGRGSLFVILGVRYIEHLRLTNFREKLPNCSLYRGKVNN